MTNQTGGLSPQTLFDVVMALISGLGAGTGIAKGVKWTLAPGDVMALGLEHHPHELVALKDDTEILSLHIHGKPHGYDEADEPRSGTIHHKPVTIPLDSDTN